VNDTIKKACEAAGWKERLGNIYPEPCYVGGDVYWFPNQRRSDLHALAGCLEDLVREKRKPMATIACADCCAVQTKFEQNTAKHDDWLMAKLEALWQVWEKVNE